MYDREVDVTVSVDERVDLSSLFNSTTLGEGHGKSSAGVCHPPPGVRWDLSKWSCGVMPMSDHGGGIVDFRTTTSLIC